LKPKDNETVSTSKVVGVLVMFLAILGLLELAEETAGGMIGFLVLWPFYTLLGGVAGGLILGAIVLISIFLTFNTGFIRPKREPSLVPEVTPAITVDGAPVPNEASDDEPEDDDEVEDVDVTEKRSVGQRLGLGKGEPSFVVSSFVGSYDPPPLTLLNKDKGKPKTGDVKANANIIKRTLLEFGINVEMDTVEIGPTVTRYSLKPAQGVKISRIVGLQRELELNLASGTIRIEAPIPGKSLVGIEVPNTQKAQVGLASLLSTPDYTDSDKPLLIALGKDITGKAHFANVARMPHGLIAGTTGSGKSVTIHNIILSLLFRNSPEQLRLIMVDPKRVELTLYDGIPHLLTPVITQAKKALLSLKWAVGEMERRYDILQAEKMQNLSGYHEKVYRPAKAEWVKNGSKEDEKMNLPEALPYIVIVMDELADLMHSYPRELEALIVRLAQMSRAVGIHLILATQRPSVNVITGTIKANIPTRLAMQVASQIDSRTILDQVGAEKLLGQGDMLYLTGELSKPVRLQSAYVTDDELKRVIGYLKSLDHVQELESIDLDSKEAEAGSNAMFGAMVDDDGDDDLYEDAKQAVLDAGKASTSYLQRKLRIGYSRAARLIDLLEERGIIGPADGAKPREILGGGGNADEGETF
jgi:DNA segregation ATPase FtsK/SpoIIIE, S-DNA-T family